MGWNTIIKSAPFFGKSLTVYRHLEKKVFMRDIMVVNIFLTTQMISYSIVILISCFMKLVTNATKYTKLRKK